MEGEYEKVELLGAGSYGKAWLVNCSKKNRQAVLKEVKLDCLSDKEIGQALVEVKVLARCRHVNIVAYCEAFLNAGCLNIVMEFAENGDMQRKILEQKGIYFENEVILDWFIQICFALKYLHSEKILHRDLKPQNLFLASDGIVKVGDFGIARILQDTADHALTAIGTPYYISPEICQHKLYNSKSDMWSAGCVLYELCCLHVPFQAPNVPVLVLKILEGFYEPIPSHCGAVLEDLVSVLLQTDPLQRPSAEQVLSVPALQAQVKRTYRRCLNYKEKQYRQRILSREAVSTTDVNEDRGKQSPSCQQTFTVHSPLLRCLSVVTPKLKAAIKRQRSVHSAEAVPSVKRQRKSSQHPVFNLYEAVLSHTFERKQSSNLDDGQHKHRKKTDSVEFMSEHTSSIEEVFDEDVKDCSPAHDLSIKDCHSTEKDFQFQDGVLDICRSKDSENHENNSKTAELPTRDKDFDWKSYDDCEAFCNENQSDLRSSFFQNRNNKHCSSVLQILSNKELLKSETYTVVASGAVPQEKPQCPVCQHGKVLLPCINGALYSATSLRVRDKSAALRCLSRFLISHLGPDFSLHICSLVNSVLHSTDGYSVLERNLDENCTKYLPVIFQLLSWCDNED